MQRIVIVVFLAFWLIAMMSYPGWNAFDAKSPSYDPLRNFLCDLLSAETPNGRNNVVSATAMTLAVSMLVVARLLPLWWNVRARGGWRTLCRALGVAASVLTLLIGIEQAFGLDLPHGTLTLMAGGFGLLPTTIVMFADWRSSRASPARRVAMLGMLVAGLVNFVSYSMVQLGQKLTPIVPTAQNCTLLLLLVWLWLKNDSHIDHNV